MTPCTKGDLALVAALAISTFAPLRAQAQVAEGGGLFLTHCSPCHGPQGKGDGAMASELLTKPPDLTRIAARNGGKFPEEMVFRIIDGRRPVKGHGGQGMPVWGDLFQASNPVKGPGGARARIDDVVKYLESIQQK